MTKQSAYDLITGKIIEALERGTVPWEKPWDAEIGAPRSIRGRAYRGINVFLLHMSCAANGYGSPLWLTFKEAKRRGGHVLKGEKATPVVFWKWIQPGAKKDDGEGDTAKTSQRPFPILRTFSVFNLDQTEDVEAPELEKIVTPDLEFDPIETAEQIQNARWIEM